MSERIESMQCEADATAKLAAVRAVLGERHTQHPMDSEWCAQCFDPDSVYEAEPAPWPCLHERVRRAVEGTNDAGEAQA